MALIDWLSSLRRGWLRSTPKRIARWRSTPLAVEVRMLEQRQLLTGTTPEVSQLAYQQGSASWGVVQGTVTGLADIPAGLTSPSVEYDLNGDSNPEGDVSIGGSGGFQYSLETGFGSQTIRTRGVAYDEEWNLVTGDWVSLTINPQPPPNDPPTLTNLQFTMSSASWGTVAGAITGNLNDTTPSSYYTLEFDLNADGSADEWEESIYGTGGFSHGTTTSFGTHTWKVRAVETNEATGNPLIGTWQNFTFTVTPPANDPPTLSNLQFTESSASWGTVSGAVTGTLVDATPSSGYTLEIDRNADGSADEWEESIYGPGAISHATSTSFGTHTWKVRAVETSEVTGTTLTGAWQDFPFTVSPPANNPPTLTNLEFTPGSASWGTVSGAVTGTLADPTASSSYSLEFDRNADGSAEEWEESIYSPGAFSHGTSVSYGTHTWKVRAVETSEVTGTTLTGVWQNFTFTVTPPLDPQLVVSQLAFTASSYAYGTAAGPLSGVVSDPNATSGGYTIQVDITGNGTVFTSFSSDLGAFSAVRSLPIGTTTIRVRALATDEMSGDMRVSGWVSLTVDLRQAAVVSAGSAANDSQRDDFVLQRDEGDLVVTVNQTEIFRQVASGVRSLDINGSGDDDWLTINHSGGDVVVPVLFNGGLQQTVTGDGMTLVGGTANQITYDYSSTLDPTGLGGTIQIDQRGLITYTGLEPIENRVFANTITVEVPAGLDNVVEVKDNGDGTFDVASSGGTFEKTTFTYPASGGTVNFVTPNSNDRIRFVSWNPGGTVNLNFTASPGNSGNWVQSQPPLTLTSSTTSTVWNAPVTLTASIDLNQVALPGTPTGTVMFKEGNTVLGQGTLAVVNGKAVATFQSTALGIGHHTITATYDGDANYAATTSGTISVHVRIHIFNGQAVNYGDVPGVEKVVNPVIMVQAPVDYLLDYAVVMMTNNVDAPGPETLAFANDGVTMGDLTSTYNATTRVLTISSPSHTATIAHYQAALRSVTYRNDEPVVANLPPRYALFVAKAGVENSTTQVVAMTFPTTNHDLVLDGATAAHYNLDQPPIPINPTLTIDETVAGRNMKFATVTLSNYFAADDELGFINDPQTMGNIVGTLSTSSGPLTLKLTSAGNTATVGEFQAALRSVTYRNRNTTPGTTAPRYALFQAYDDVVYSNIVTTITTMSKHPDAPTLTGASSPTFNRHQTALTINGALAATDSTFPPSQNTFATVTLSNYKPLDELSFTAMGDISGEQPFIDSNGQLVLKLKGTTATLSQYVAAMQAVTYRNQSSTLDTTIRRVNFQIFDGTYYSNILTSNVNITTDNNAPTDITPLAFSIDDDRPVNELLGTLTTADLDPTDIFTYTWSGPDAAAFDAKFKVVGNGELRIKANLDATLKNQYSVIVTSTDQGGLSVSKNLTITVLPKINHAPTDIQLSSATLTDDKPAGSVVGTFTTTDPDAGNAFTYTLSGPNATTFEVVNGQLKTTGTLVSGQYPITVTSEDQGNLSVTKDFTISVTHLTPLLVTMTGAELANGAALHFGSTSSGLTVSRTITVTNNTVNNITGLLIQAASGSGISASTAGATDATSTPFDIAAGASRDITLTFNATASGAYTVNWQLVSGSNTYFSGSIVGNITAALDQSLVKIVDDNSADVGIGIVGQTPSAGNAPTLPSEWSRKSSAGYNGTVAVTTSPNNFDKEATWNFGAISPGYYRLSTTWGLAQGDGFSGSMLAVAPFTIKQGGTPLDTVVLSQATAPDDFFAAGVSWEDLGYYYLDTAALAVVLNAPKDLTNNRVIADAVRLEKVNPSPDQIFVPQNLSQVEILPALNDHFPLAPFALNQGTGSTAAAGKDGWQVVLDSSSAVGGTVTPHLDGTFTFQFNNAAVSQGSFSYHLEKGPLSTGSVPVYIHRLAAMILPHADSAATSYRQAVTVDVAANDQIASATAFAPVVTGVRNGWIDPIDPNTGTVYDNGFFLKDPSGGWTLNVTPIGSTTSIPIPYVGDTAQSTAGLPAGVTLNRRDLGNGYSYVRLHVIDPQQAAPGLKLSVAGNPTPSFFQQARRGVVQTKDDRTITFTPDDALAAPSNDFLQDNNNVKVGFFRATAGAKLDADNVPGRQVSLYGAYDEVFSYAFRDPADGTKTLAANLAGVDNTVTIRVQDTAPTFVAPKQVIIPTEGVSGNPTASAAGNYLLKIASADTDGDGLITANLQSVKTTNLNITYNDSKVLDQQLQLRVNQGTYSPTDINTQTVVLSDGITFSNLQTIRYGAVKYSGGRAAITGVGGANGNPPLGSSGADYDATPVTWLDNSYSPFVSSTKYQVTAAVEDSRTTSTTTLGSVGVDLATGNSSITQSLPLSIRGGTQSVTLRYDSRTVNTAPTLQGTVSVPLQSSQATNVRVRVRWYKVGTDSNGIPSYDQASDQNWAAGGETLFQIPANQTSAGFAIQGGLFKEPRGTGEYRWELETTVFDSNFTQKALIQSYGNAVIVVNTQVSTGFNPFKGLGDGFSLEGVPYLVIEKNKTGTTGYQPWLDDRVSMVNPGRATRFWQPYGGNSLGSETGWEPIDPSFGGLDREESGKLVRNSTISPTSWIYTADDGTEYTFEENSAGTGAYLQKIHPLTGADTVFKLMTDGSDLISEITAADGTITKFNYSSGQLTQIEQKPSLSGAPVRQWSATFSGSALTQIDLQDSSNTTVTTRTFGYAQQTDVQIDSLSSGSVAVNVGGTTVTLTTADFASPTALENKFAGIAGLQVGLINPNPERHHWLGTDPNPSNTTNFGDTSDRTLRFVFNGSHFLNQTVSITAGGAGELHVVRTVRLLARDQIGTVVRGGVVRTDIAYDSRGLVNGIVAGEALDQTWFVIATAASQKWIPVVAPSTSLPQSFVRTIASAVQKLDGSNTPVNLNQDRQTEYALDGKGRVLAITNYAIAGNGPKTQLGAAEFWSRDLRGNVVAATDALGRTTRFTYDYNDPTHLYSANFDPLAVSLRGGDGFLGSSSNYAASSAPLHQNVTQIYRHYVLASSQFDPATGQALRQTDALGRTTYYALNAAGQVLAMVGPGDEYMDYTYNTAVGVVQGLLATERTLLVSPGTGQLPTLSTGNVRTRSWTYGTNGAVGQEIGQESVTAQQYDSTTNSFTDQTRTVGYSYDLWGNVAITTDGLGNVTTTAYDAAGRLLLQNLQDAGQSSALIAQTTYHYRDDGQVDQMTDGRGIVTQYEYDTRGLLTSTTRDVVAAPIDQQTTSQTYYQDGSLHTVTYPDGHTATMYYDFVNADGSLTEWTQTNGLQKDYVPIANTGGLQVETVKSVTDAVGRMTSTENLLTGAKTEYSYDANDNLIATTQKDVNKESGNSFADITTTQRYDAVGNLVAVQSPNVDLVVSQYDSRDQVIRTEKVDAHASAMDYTYDADGNPLTATETRWTPVISVAGVVTGYQSAALTTTTRYNGFGEAVETKLPGNGNVNDVTTTRIDYDEIGRAKNTHSVTAQGTIIATTTLVLDALGRTISETAPDGTVTQTDYDLNGNVTGVQLDRASGPAAIHRRTKFTYDHFDRLEQTDEMKYTNGSFATDRMTTYVYDLNVGSFANDGLSRVTVTDPEGRETITTLDAFGKIVSQVSINPDGDDPETRFNYSYNTNAKTLTTTRTERLDASRWTNTKTLTNTVGWVLQERDVDDRPAVDTRYDTSGRPTNVARDGQGQTTYLYDPHTGLPSEIRQASTALGTPNVDPSVIMYDSVGNRVYLNDPQGNQTRWEYDARGRVTKETTRLDELDGNGLPTGNSNNDQVVERTWTYRGHVTGLGIVTDYKDRDDRITRSILSEDGLTLTERWYAPGVDPNGPVIPLREIITQRNAAGETVVASSQGAGAPNSLVEMTFDSVGRPLSETQTLGSTTVLIDTTWNDPARTTTRTFTLDSAATAGTAQTLTYQRNALGQVIQVAQNFFSSNSALWANGSVGQAKRIDLTYMANGARDTLQRYLVTSNGTSNRGYSNYDYLNDGRLSLLQHQSTQGGPAFANYTNGYDRPVPFLPTGQLFKQTTFLDDGVDGSPLYNQAVLYEYWPDGQLKRIGTQDLSGQTPGPQVWGPERHYDVNGNQDVGKIIGKGNRQLDDEQYRYRYDLEGHLVSKITKPMNVRDNSDGPLVFVEGGNWTTTNSGLDGSQRVTTETLASLQIRMPAVAAGNYQLYATWDAIIGAGQGHYQLNGATGTLNDVDFSAAPSGIVDVNGRHWQELGQIVVASSGEIEITLNGAFGSVGAIIGDAFQLIPVGQVVRSDYQWDHRGRIVETEEFGTAGFVTERSVYGYDALDRRISRELTTYSAPGTGTTGTTRYVFDGNREAFELNESGEITQASFNGTEAGEVWAIDDALNTDPTTTVWQFADPQGSARTLARMDGNGTWVVQQRMFDGDGELVDRLGAASDTVLAAIPSIWNGQRQDVPTGLYGTGAQIYDASSGRFIDQASAGTDSNPYRYENGDPVNGSRNAIGGVDADGYSSGFNRAIGTSLENVIGTNRLAGLSDTSIYAGVGLVAVGSAAAIWYVGGTAVIASLATPGVTTGFVGVGATAGFANGVASVYAGGQLAGTNPGLAGYTIGGALGTVSGALNPFDGVASFGLGLAGAGIGQLNGNASAGYLTGSTIGSVITPGVEDFYRNSAMLAFNARLGHSLARSGVALGGFSAAAVATLANGGDLNSALFYGNFGAMGAGALSRLIPCFPAGTPILTSEGSKPIEELRAGDLVLSRDQHNVEGSVAPKVIEETFVRHGEIYELRIGGRLIEVTPEHPVFVEGKGWTPVGDVMAGDVLSIYTLPTSSESRKKNQQVQAVGGVNDRSTDTAIVDSDQWLVVESSDSTGRFETVYNFRVADWHTYFVGAGQWEFGLWVHNAGKAYVSGSYGILDTVNGQERNHLLQQKAFPHPLNLEYGPVVRLKGSTAKFGSQHNLFHRVLEGFWEPHRIAATTPLVGEYLDAVGRGARAAGFSPKSAYQMTNSARRFLNRIDLGVDDFVPFVPKRFPSQFLPGGLL